MTPPTESPPVRRVVFAHMSTGSAVDSATLSHPRPTREWAFGEQPHGRGVRVCVIDSGVDPDRGDLSQVDRWTVADDLGVVRDDGPDAAGHGTACCHIIQRLAPGVELTSVRVLGGTLSCTSEVLLSALEWSIARRFDVVNLSLSTSRNSYKQLFHDLSDAAEFAGVSIVASAHNRPVRSFPWTFASTFSVGAHAHADPERLEANTSPPVMFFGAGVRVPVPREGRTAYVSGNSYATPHVTAFIARIKAQHPAMSNVEVKHVLTSIADNINEKGE